MPSICSNHESCSGLHAVAVTIIGPKGALQLREPQAEEATSAISLKVAKVEVMCSCGIPGIASSNFYFGTLCFPQDEEGLWAGRLGSWGTPTHFTDLHTA